MLVVCNGSMKSGSTWITQIVAAHGKWAPIPNEFRNSAWYNPSVDPDKYDEFFSAGGFETSDWFCKQHWRGEKKYYRLLEDPAVRVINIVRDLRDVLVSRYFHDVRLKDTTADNIHDYYYHDRGRSRLRGYIDYHRFWHGPDREKQPHLCVYENLQSDFAGEVRGLFEYLGQSLDQQQIERIQEETSFKNKKVTGEGEFFRKGIVGDWANHLTAEMLDDIEKLMVSSRYPHEAIQRSISNAAGRHP